MLPTPKADEGCLAVAWSVETMSLAAAGAGSELHVQVLQWLCKVLDSLEVAGGAAVITLCQKLLAIEKPFQSSRSDDDSGESVASCVSAQAVDVAAAAGQHDEGISVSQAGTTTNVPPSVGVVCGAHTEMLVIPDPSVPERDPSTPPHL